MKRLLLIGALGALGLLGACGTIGGTSTGGPAASNSNPIGDLVTFTKADLAAAENNAVTLCNANPNASACIVVPCPPAIDKWIDATAGAAGQLQVKGLFSGAVAGQAVVDGVQQGIPDYVYTACGPAYMKLHADLYKLIGKAALIGGG